MVKERNKGNEIVLTDFVFLDLPDPVQQQDANTVLIKGMTKALAVKSGVQSEQEVNRIHKRVYGKFKHFAVSSNTISRRYMILWPKDYSAALTAKISENGRFVNHVMDFPMFEELVMEHRNPEGAGLNRRMSLFQQYAEKYIKCLYNDDITAPDKIIHVTSSGYHNPNPVDKFLAEKGWYDSYVVNFYHRACNASIPAIQAAEAYMKSLLISGEKAAQEKRVDIVHSEMFSVHLRIDDDDPVNIALMTTYSDSFMRYSLKRYSSVRKSGGAGLKILAIRNQLIPDSSSVAAWNVAEPAFDLDINPFKYINLVRKHVRQFVISFLHDAGFDFRELTDKLLYVLQASGTADLEAVARQLKLRNDQVANTRKLLFEKGYLSSTAIPYMCKQIVESDDVQSGQKVLCLGHAQGVYLSAILLEKI